MTPIVHCYSLALRYQVPIPISIITDNIEQVSYFFHKLILKLEGIFSF
jgi:hypothetical protein